MPGPAPDTAERDDGLLLIQLLCTRLCHDLVGPVGAVAAGVELAAGDPSQVDAETLALIGGSSAAASRKLKFLRAAWGMPSSSSSANLQALTEGYLEAVAGRSGAAALHWPPDSEIVALTAAVGPTATALVLNLCLLVVEALPVCRQLEISIDQVASPRIVVIGHGDPQKTAAWRPEIVDAVSARPALALSAKTIQPYLVGSSRVDLQACKLEYSIVSPK